MGDAIFIGDELSATGFRLAGVKTLVPALDDVGPALAAARSHAALIIMTAEFARHVPALELEAALLAESPTLAIIPDMRFRIPLPDLEGRLRRTLGIET